RAARHWHVQPVQDLLAAGAPHAGGGLRRRRTADAHTGDLETRDGVEEGGLAGAGGAGEGDDRVLLAQAHALVDALQQRLRILDGLLPQGVASQLQRGAQAVGAPRQLRVERIRGRCGGVSGRRVRHPSASSSAWPLRRSVPACRGWTWTAVSDASKGSRHEPTSSCAASTSRVRTWAARSRVTWSPKIVSSSLPATTAVVPAMPTSAPVRPPVPANAASMRTAPTPLTPKDR